MMVSLPELVDSKGDWLNKNLTYIYMTNISTWRKWLYIWRKWHYVGEHNGLKYVIFSCEEHGLKFSHNHGREDKLRVWCDECKEYIHFGYWGNP